MASVTKGIMGGVGATATFATAEADGPPGGDATGASVLPIWATAELEAAQTKPTQRTHKLAFLRAHPVFGDAGCLKNAFCGLIANSAYHFMAPCEGVLLAPFRGKPSIRLRPDLDVYGPKTLRLNGDCARLAQRSTPGAALHRPKFDARARIEKTGEIDSPARARRVTRHISCV